jgi:hypothetical protein
MKSTLQIALISIALAFAVGCSSQAEQNLAQGWKDSHAKIQRQNDCLNVKLELMKAKATPLQMDSRLKRDGCWDVLQEIGQ